MKKKPAKRKSLTIMELLPNGEMRQRRLRDGDILEIDWRISAQFRGKQGNGIRLGTVMITAFPKRPKKSDLSIYFEADKSHAVRALLEFADKLDSGEEA